jgi:membrane carboxypeptidase/penicillin-binding protein
MSIADREGNILLENRPEPHEALRADTAFVMTNLLRGVVQRGTAQAAAALDWPLAGKTGTMDEYTDAWFIGFDPNITVGVWVGYDEKKPLGNGETGAAAALPIWMDFVKVYLEKYGDRKNPPQFEAPGNIVFVTLDSGVSEAFINGTQPAVPATRHQPGTLPTPVQQRHRRHLADDRVSRGSRVRRVRVVMLPPQRDAFERRNREHQRGAHTNQHLNGIEERGHDEGDEEEPIHQQQRHAAVVADHFAPVPAQKSEHVDLLQATRVSGHLRWPLRR